MRVGISVWEGRVSPVLDAAERLAVFEFGPGADAEATEVRLPTDGVARRAAVMSELGLDVLICGAVTRRLADTLVAHGVSVVPWISGTVEEVLRALDGGELAESRFAMPGCRCRRQRVGRGRRASSGRGPGGRRGA